MSDAFISYSRLDKEFVGKLREALADKGQDVWIDWESIPASQLWWQEIQKGIAKANNFVLIMSPNSMSSPICQMEIEDALKEGKRIIPVFHEDFNREDCLLNIAKRLALKDETATREIWGNRQAHDLYDANLTAIKPINYFSFKSDADFEKRFDELFKIIDTDPVYKEKHTTLGLRSAEWDRRKRDVSFLLLGSELTDAEKWRQEAGTKEPSPTELQTAYINDSRRSANRRRNITISGVLIATAALVFAVGASLVGVNAVNQMATATVAQGQAQNAAVTATIAQGAAVNAQGTAVAQADNAQLDAKNARTEVAVAGATLSPVPPTLTAVASALANAKIEQDIGEKVANASFSIADKSNAEALRTVNQLVEAYPNTAMAYIGRGVIYEHTNQFDKATADYSKAIELDPNSLAAYHDRGIIYYDQKQYDRAINDFTKATELDPNFARAYYDRGNTYKAMKQPDKALADYSKAIELDANYVSAYDNRANLYSDLNLTDKALADFNKAIELDPNDANTYYNRGLIYDNLKQSDKALADYSKAIELDPSAADAYFNRGKIYIGLEQSDKALADFNKTIELDPKNAEAYNNRGGILNDQGQYDKALPDFNKAIELDPNDADAYNNRGNAYSKLGQYDKAVSDYNKVLVLDPNDANAHTKRGVAYAQLGKLDDSITDFTQAMAMDPKDLNNFLLRGLDYYSQKNYKEALADWDEVEKLGGTLPSDWEGYRTQAEAALTQTPTTTPTSNAAKS